MPPRDEGARYDAEPGVGVLSSLVALAISYGIGFAVCGLFGLFVAGGFGLVIAVAGAIIALPLLGIAALVLVVFRRSIAAHRLAWCLVAPPAVLLTWLGWEYVDSYRRRGFTLSGYLQLENVVERAALVALTAAAASAAFSVVEPLVRERRRGRAEPRIRD